MQPEYVNEVDRLSKIKLSSQYRNIVTGLTGSAVTILRYCDIKLFLERKFLPLNQLLELRQN